MQRDPLAATSLVNSTDNFTMIVSFVELTFLSLPMKKIVV